MRTSTLLSSLLLSTASASIIPSRVLSAPKTQDTNYPVAGENPLFYCSDPSKNILQIESVSLHPNPPVPGQKLLIQANGTATEDVEDGATVFLQVKYGLITLIKQEADMCENLPKIDIKCPVKKGFMQIEKEVDIPKQVPPGKYTVIADAKTKDKEALTCLESTVVFSRG